jgi:hypothetical protein
MKFRNHNLKISSAAAVFFTLCGLLLACREQFSPAIKENTVSYLVVEGLINTGADSTIFNLSRTFKLNNKAVIGAERGAIVQVESEAGITYVLPELLKAGRYGQASLGLDKTKKYRLRIRTKDNREYLSDFVESKTSPPFDLKYDFKNSALNFYVDTHDPSGKSRYYQHSYDETWEYESKLRSFYKLENGKVVDRKFPEDNIFNCWHVAPSGKIMLSSTANLSQDRISDKLILSVPGTSSKVDIEYSVLIRQTVLTKQGFEFFETLKKNTESVGNIFDAQPSQLFGNIKSTTDASETIIGFVTCGTVVEKRFLIQLPDLPIEWFSAPLVDSDCIKSVRSIDQFKVGPFIPITKVSGTDLLYCADCRTQGGTTQRPSYWR